MSSKTSACSITIFIPTYNGDTYLAEILRMIYLQRINYSYEVLVIDSGSTDNTLPIIHDFMAKHDNLRLHQIANTEYGHGKTRNLAATMAQGDIVVYLSHDAIPAHDRWLYEMVRPFEIDDKIVGVMGKQIPRNHCIPMLKSEINGVFSGFGPDFGVTLFYKDDFIKDQGTYDAVGFYSDANSAARRSCLVDTVPYRDVKYAEDQLFGRDVIEKGLYKAYAPRGCVVHSNDLTLREYSGRMFDETYGLRVLGIAHQGPSMKAVFKMIIRGVIRDTRNIIQDRNYSMKRKVYWIFVNPLFHVEKWRGVRRAYKVTLKSGDISKYSLEATRAPKA